ncbi:substrate-binding domain-containing protein, partial [Salmonella enterica subsp. enterica serovar 1,4,[5],12:i:-]
ARAPIEAAGAAIAPHHVGVAAQTDWVEGRRAAAAILDAPGPRPTAIIAVNDILAAAGIVECQSRGIRVPEDVSIGGNGDSDLAQSFEPSITTVTV